MPAPLVVWPGKTGFNFGIPTGAFDSTKDWLKNLPRQLFFACINPVERDEQKADPQSDRDQAILGRPGRRPRRCLAGFVDSSENGSARTLAKTDALEPVREDGGLLDQRDGLDSGRNLLDGLGPGPVR